MRLRLPRRARTPVARFDRYVDGAVEKLRGSPLADRLFYGASALGDYSLIWLMLGALRGVRSERDWHAGVRVGAAMGLESILVNGLIKSVVGRTRPAWELDRPRHLRRPLTSSFPSGHATSSFTSAVLLSDGDPLWPLYYTVACVVAASRVYVKIHHASDVVAGAALGLLLGHMGRRLAPLPALAGEEGAPGAISTPPSGYRPQG